jgi:hypothetical protein
MSHAWEILAFSFLLGAAFATGKLLGWLIDRPDPGTRAKPHTGTHVREWPWRERAAFRVSGRAARRQRERDRDAATVDTFRDILAGQYMGEEAERAMWGECYGQPGEPGWEGTAEDYALDMAAGPLMPLPPEVVDDWAESDQALCLCPLGPDVPGPPITTEADCPAHAHLVPADPLDVLGDDACADALVGPVGTCRSGQGHDYDRCPGCDACRGCHPHDPGMGCLPYLTAVPVPRDDYADLAAGQYAEATGQFSRALLGEYERAHAGGAA